MTRLGPRDRVDLSIPLRGSEELFFKQALETLEEEGGILEHQVTFGPRLLHINAVDLISLLAFADTSALSELECHALERKLERALSALELNATSASSRAHYIWCKTALKSFDWGRFLQGEEDE